MMKQLNNHYSGGKGGDGTYQQIINYIPPHNVYVSPFAGKDAIYRNLLPGSIAIINDADPQIINYWKHYLKAFDPLKVRKSKKQLYAFEFADESQHVALLETITQCTCNVMISTYDNDLYNTYLAAWNKHSFVSQTRQGQAIETIYFNYEPPVILHDFRYLGKNFRERERIKRKVKRFQDRMHNLPPAERNAILSAAVKDHNETLSTIIHL